MIHDVGKALQAKLREQGCPVSVFDRESQKTATFANERIVIEHEGDDRFTPVRGQHTNPKQRFTRSVAVKITIYAVGVRSGSLEFEHRGRAEKILDAVLVALGDVAGERPAPIFDVWAPTGGRFIVADDLQGSERFGGAVYELTLTINRAVKVQTWAGEKMPEATIGDVSITNTNNVSIAGAVGEETACGA